MASEPSRRSKADEVEAALAKQPSSFRSWFIEEPLLTFQRGHSPDPKTGIAAHGVWRDPSDTSTRRITVGIVGTGDTIGPAQHWLARCRNPVHPAVDERVSPILSPSFPGLATPTSFNVEIETPANLIETLTPAEVSECVSRGDRDGAVEEIGARIRERLCALAEKDRRPDVVIVALSKDIRDAAGDGRSAPRRRPRNKPTKQLTLSFLDSPPPNRGPLLSRTLHRVIKAAGMKAGLPTQLAWPGTFAGGEGVEDDATRAWNFCTALFYKAGGVPWRVSGLVKNTCYVGISFYRPIAEGGLLQTSMAQAFSDRGDGLVLRGESFEWDTKTQGSPRLTREAARRLLTDVLQHYTAHLRQKPLRVVVHKSSEFGDEELDGFADALGSDIPFYDFVSIRRSDVRFLRAGDEPPIRGTAVEIAPRRFVFYTRGYVPYLRVYPGMRIPRPLLVTQHRGAGNVTEMLGEMLALTKLNWNSAAFAHAEPITLAFSRTVGLILSELPADTTPQPLYRYYM
jgi:hypothetical protein